MNVSTKAFLRAARNDWRRSLAVVAAIALGIAAFTAVLAAQSVLVRALDRGYAESSPAHATLWLDRVDAALVAEVRLLPAIEEAEARRSWSGRIQAKPRGWKNLVLFAVDDFAATRVGKLHPEDGMWPPGPGELLIERDAFQVAGLVIGDEVKVALVDGREATLRVAGSVHDVGQAQARMEQLVYGYVDRATLPMLGVEPVFDRLLVRFAPEPADREASRRAAAELEARLETLGQTVHRVDVPAPGEHPHSDLMRSLLLAKAGFGAGALLLAGILVLNLLTARMSAEVRQIGVMKTLGGTRARIARLYWQQALALGAAALIPGLPLGLWGSWLLCRWQARFLNFDVVDFAPPAWVYLAVVVVGVFLPQLAAAWPIWRSSGISVRAALLEHGVREGGPGEPALALGVGRGAWSYVARNLLRQRGRTLRTGLVLAVAGILFLGALNLRASMIATIDALFAGRRYELSVSFGAMVPRQEVEAVLGQVAGVRAVEGWVGSGGSFPEKDPAAEVASTAKVRHGHGGRGRGFTVLAIPAETPMLALDLIAGRGLRTGDETAIVVNSAAAARFPEFRLGQDVTFRLGPADTTWQVVGVAREPMTQPIVYLPRLFYDRRHPDSATTFRVALESEDSAAVEAAKEALDAALRQAGFQPRAISGKADNRVGFDQHLLMIYAFLLAMAGILAGVGLLALGTATSLNIAERSRELAVLRTLGASPAKVATLLVAESCLLALGAALLAVAVAWPAGEKLGGLIVGRIFPGGLDRALDPRGVALWLALSLLLAALASALPAWRAARRPIAESLNHP